MTLVREPMLPLAIAAAGPLKATIELPRMVKLPAVFKNGLGGGGNRSAKQRGEGGEGRKFYRAELHFIFLVDGWLRVDTGAWPRNFGQETNIAQVDTQNRYLGFADQLSGSENRAIATKDNSDL